MIRHFMKIKKNALVRTITELVICFHFTNRIKFNFIKEINH